MFTPLHAKLIFSALLILLLSGNVFADQPQSHGYRLGVGDKLKVSVFGHSELSGEFVVGGNGNIVMPLIQGIQSQGLTTDELANAVTHRLSPDYLVNPRVSVELLTYRPFYIMGEVRNPGSYPYVEGMTALNAIAVAGGYERRANKDMIIIERKQRSKPIKTLPQAKVRPGDVITIKERFF